MIFLRSFYREVLCEDISKRMRTIEGVVVMDGVKLQTSKYFENYKLLQTEYKKRHAQEYVVDETIEKKDSNAFLGWDKLEKLVKFFLQNISGYANFTKIAKMLELINISSAYIPSENTGLIPICKFLEKRRMWNTENEDVEVNNDYIDQIHMDEEEVE